jgi:hypothetical protein
MAIGEQSRKINKILRDVNTAVMNRSSEAVDTGEKLIAEYGYYRYRGMEGYVPDHAAASALLPAPGRHVAVCYNVTEYWLCHSDH